MTDLRQEALALGGEEMRTPADFLEDARVFVRIYRMPDKLTNGYCFGAGVPIPFLNVDWFEMLEQEGREGLIEFVKRKQYYQPFYRFLVIGNKPEFTFTIEATMHPATEPRP